MADEAASILDAFVVTIGLDASGVESGRKKAISEIKKLRDDAVQGANDAERRNKRVADSVGAIRNEVVGLALAFAGANGIKDFVGNILGNDAAVGRFAANIGATTQAVSAWQYAVQSVGGSAQDAMGSLQAMQNVIEAHRMGQSSAADPALRLLGLRAGEDQDPAEMLRILSENRNHLNRGDQVSLLQQAGIDQNSINVIVKGRAELERLNREAQKAGVVSAEDAKAAEDLQAAWNNLTTTIKGEARPEITELANGLAGLAKNGDTVKTAAEAAGAVIAAVGVAAAIAYAPVVALAGVLLVAAKAYEELSRANPAARASRSLSEDGKLISDLYGALHGDPHGMIGRIQGVLANDKWTEFGVPIGGKPAGVPSAVAQTKFGQYQNYFKAQGFTDAQAEGIARGIFAESGNNPNSVNPTSGAYGLGQWLGARRQRLRAMFGDHPDEKAQLQFLAWELKGGDRGGARVRQTRDADTALLEYVYAFMRPDARGALQDVARGRSIGRSGARLSVRNASHASHHSETHIGKIEVHTKATDGKGIAKDLPPAIKRRGLTSQAPSGLSG